MNFHNAGIVHVIWKKYLKDYLDGKERSVPKDMGTYKECELGKWLGSGIIEKHPDMPELRQLEKVHREYHLIIDNVINFKKNGNDKVAQSEYENLEKKGKEMIGILTVLTMQM